MRARLQNGEICKWKCLIVLFSIAIPIVAAAQDAELVFRALDRNGDGRITQQEAQANELVLENFSAADANNDGYLSLAEFSAAFGSG
jgi:Ca2+-binding EF-hand superfamily protein